VQSFARISYEVFHTAISPIRDLLQLTYIRGIVKRIGSGMLRLSSSFILHDLVITQV